jgi:hypothetical protein
MTRWPFLASHARVCARPRPLAPVPQGVWVSDGVR